MELTIEQALQQGVTAHKEGKLQDAERLYRAILQSQPLHPDANHNLGVLAVSVNKADAALPLFKTALEANPKIEQFWLSYIDALIKEHQFEQAKQVFEQAKTQGVAEEKLTTLESQLSSVNKIDNVSNVKPPQAQLSALLEYYKTGRFGDAEKLALSVTKDFPEHPFAWKILGAVLRQTGRKEKAISANQNVVILSPREAAAYNNLAITLQEFGRLEEAEASYNQAIALKPDYAEAHSNLGNTLKELGRLDEAEASYNQAIALKPDYPNAHNNLAATLKELGRPKEAIVSFKNAVALEPDFFEAYQNLGITFKELGRMDGAVFSFIRATELEPESLEAHKNLGVTLTVITAKHFSRQLEKSYLNLLNLKTIVRPNSISPSIVSLLKHHETVKEAIQSDKKNDIKDTVCEVSTRLSNIPLFLKIIELCPIQDLEIESLLKNLRKILLLENRALLNNHDLLRFQHSLALQCFTNEFIYEETEEETLAIKTLETVLQKSFDSDEAVSPYQIACLSSYRPLHLYPWATHITPPPGLEILFARQVKEVHQERTLQKNIPRLTSIENDISLSVQKQYEANPYPRWINTQLTLKPLTIAQLLSELEFELDGNLDHFSETPQVLIAGCGTGQQSIGSASRLKNCHVTAVDLSLSSLSYAMRKSREYGVENIDYIQADILDLELLGKKFDIVESVGVLHHMENPLLGWKVLEHCLKPGGLMKIGLYGEVSREHIVKARDIISQLGIGTSKKEMIEFREYIKRSTDPVLSALKKEVDFYSTSTFRDLVFHVQEHRFTAPELYKCFNTLNLTFIGFEYPNVEEKRHSQAQYPNWGHDSNGGSSDDLDFPTYCFWLQKPQSSYL